LLFVFLKVVCAAHNFLCHFLLVQKVTKKDPAIGHPTMADHTLIKQGATVVKSSCAFTVILGLNGCVLFFTCLLPDNG